MKEKKTLTYFEQTIEPTHLRASFRKVQKAKGLAVGVDEVSLREFLRKNDPEEVKTTELVENLHEELSSGTYVHQPIRRAFIPKYNRTLRPLGIPTLRDRVVQQAVKQIIEPLFERQFLDCSYGYRPGRDVHKALHQVKHLYLRGYTWAAKMDIKNFFDNVDHKKLLAEIRRQGGSPLVQDSRLMALLTQFLNADVVYNDEVIESPSASGKGTPQGGVISPLFANIYLHPLDDELTRAGFKLVRYADDILLLAKTRDRMQPALKKTLEVLKDLGLKECRSKRVVKNWSQQSVAFLGFNLQGGGSYTPTGAVDTCIEEYKRRLATSPDQRKKERKGSPDSYLRGWTNFHEHADDAHLWRSRLSRLATQAREEYSLEKED